MNIFQIVASCTLTAFFTVCIYLLVDTRKYVKQKADELNKLKENLPKQYVLKDDYIRQQAALERKIDIMCKKIEELMTAFAKHFGEKKND